jgi:two-component system, response regulator PdtaR
VSPRVVVVEDESLIRLDLVEMLTEAGYEVVGQAGDGETGVRLVRELRPDLVLMDVKMPVLDGISAAEALAEDCIAPIVLLTAFSQSDLVERALSAGVQGYVVKPFTLAELRPAIEIARARFAEVRRLPSRGCNGLPWMRAFPWPRWLGVSSARSRTPTPDCARAGRAPGPRNPMTTLG